MVKKAKSKTTASKSATPTKTTKATVTSSSASATATTPKGDQRLKKRNLLLAAVFALQAAAILIFSSGDKTVPVTTQYNAVDTLASAANGHQVLGMATRHLFDVRLTVLVAVFLGILAVVHLLVATKYRQKYEAQVRDGISAARWIGLGLSGGVMLVTVALLSGISQLSSLVVIFVSMVLGCALVPAAEILEEQSEKGACLPHVVCGGALVMTKLPWVMIILSILGSLLYGGHVTAGMWSIYGTMLVLYVILLGVTHMRMERKGKWADTMRTERMYMLLGLVMASALAWQVVMLKGM